jgi:hypothetical protein
MAHRIQEPIVETPKIRVLSRGTALVPDYAALIGAGMKRFVGWVHDPTLGEKFTDPENGQIKRTGGFVKLTDEHAVIPADSPYMGEYIRHVREGDLWPADPASATACGVAFESDFFGEHPKMTAKYSKPKMDGTRVPSADKMEKAQ